MDQVALIALGSNRPSPAGSPVDTVKSAIDSLDSTSGLSLIAVSPLYRTPAFPPGAGPDYVNAAAAFSCNLPAGALLVRLHEIEAVHHRSRDMRWGARSLDLDLLALGNQVLPSNETWRHWHDLPLQEQARIAPDELILPHPRLQDRAFVLVPLAEIAPDWRHPVLHQTAAELRDRLPPTALGEVETL